jgi:hypothetical protein
MPARLEFFHYLRLDRVDVSGCRTFFVTVQERPEGGQISQIRINGEKKKKQSRDVPTHLFTVKNELPHPNELSSFSA